MGKKAEQKGWNKHHHGKTADRYQQLADQAEKRGDRAAAEELRNSAGRFRARTR